MQEVEIAESHARKVAKYQKGGNNAGSIWPAVCTALFVVDRTAEDLKARIKRFTFAVFDFIETLPRTTGAFELARQLSRSGMGVAGNYRSACRARSHAEFTARLGIVLEEADEAELWLDISDKNEVGRSRTARAAPR